MKKVAKPPNFEISLTKLQLFSPKTTCQNVQTTRLKRPTHKHTRSDVSISHKKQSIGTPKNTKKQPQRRPKASHRIYQKPSIIIPTLRKHRRLLSDQYNVEVSKTGKSGSKKKLQSNSTKKLIIVLDPDVPEPDHEVPIISTAETSLVPETVELSKLPSFPISPKEALVHKKFLLTPYEHHEISEYTEIYFLGDIATKVNPTPFASDNFGYDNDRNEYHIVEGDHIAYRYEVISKLGRGSFGQVVKVFDHKEKKQVALKIIRNKPKFYHEAGNEIRLLNFLNEKNENGSYNIVKMLDSFVFRNHMCISFELLSISLYEFLKYNHFKGLRESLVRRYAVQVLHGLSLLNFHSIIHCDLKPENILLESPSTSIIKIVDFGSSCFLDERIYTYIQSRFYRAPEVILGVPYSTSIDMWSFGCLLAELYSGRPLFPGSSESEQMLLFIELLGRPPANLLGRSKRKHYFFDSTGHPRLSKHRKFQNKCFDVVLAGSSPQFKKLVKACLTWEPELRITPSEALQHEWILNSNSMKENTPRHRRSITDISEAGHAALIYKQEILKNFKRSIQLSFI